MNPLRGLYKLNRIPMDQYGRTRSTFAIYFAMRLFIYAVIIWLIVTGQYKHTWQAVLGLVFLWVPPLFEKKFQADLPPVFTKVILFFIFAFFILGEVFSFMGKIPWWDTMLHTTNGFLAAAVGFSLVLLLNNDDKLMFSCSPFFVALVAFCFSMTIGVVWEFFECFCDLMWGLDMQKDTIVHTISSVTINPDGLQEPVAISNIHQTIVDGQMLPIDGYLDIGILDTMEDLFVNFIGALTFSTIGFFALRNQEKKSGVVAGLMIKKK